MGVMLDISSLLRASAAPVHATFMASGAGV
jgi:hypothetical protein